MQNTARALGECKADTVTREKFKFNYMKFPNLLDSWLMYQVVQEN